ncbi:MAG: hypothetical protein ACK5KP_09375 [Paludibacteraceae bacterium]
MKEKIYTNIDAVQFELECLKVAQTDFEKLSQFLTENKLQTNRGNIEDLVTFLSFAGNKSLSIISNEYRAQESSKIRSIIDKIGESILTEDWEQKVVEKTKEFISNFKMLIPAIDFESENYIDYFTFDGDVKLIDEDFEALFIKKHSIYLDKKAIQEFNKICHTADMLNDIIGGAENEFIELNKRFFYNTETKLFEVRIDYFDKERTNLDFVSKREKAQEMDLANRQIKKNNNNPLLGHSISPFM